MRADEGKRLCQEAEVHYYDLLGPDEAAVPELVRRHVAVCPACQEQMRRLRQALFEDQGLARPASPGKDGTVEALAQQFQLLDEEVTCADIRPFLPKLALAVPQIRIPTPVTVHLDHCSPCAADLAALRALDLTPDQLERLSGFFASTGDEDLPRPRADETAEIACRAISPADLFDAVISYGAPRDQRHGVVASHLRACGTCGAKASRLRHTIWAILERRDSETTTVYRVQSDSDGAPQEAENLYPYPIDVQVLRGESVCRAGPPGGPSVLAPEPDDSPAGAMDGVRAARRFFSRRHLARAAVVAVTLAVLLIPQWVQTPTASGTDVGGLLKTLAKVRSLRIVKLFHDKPIQEFWMAYGSNKLVMRIPGQRDVLYDLDRGRKWTIEPGARVSPPAKMSRTEWDWARRLMSNCLREVMAPVSLNTELHPPTGELGPRTVENLDVLETTWLPHAGGPPVHRGLRVYIDPAKGLPQKTELYQERLGKARGWDLTTTAVFTYPTEQEMDRDIEGLFPAR